MNTIFQKDFSTYFFNKKSGFTWPGFMLFALTASFYFLIKLGFHELWKDEWQAWHVARDMSWTEMFQFLYYEGHPSLWYIYLKLVTLICPRGMDLYALQLSHSILVLTTFAVLFFRFDFQLLLKLAIALSFFCFFEYGMVNRGYALVMLLSFVAAALLKDLEKNSWKLAGVLILLCQTEAQGVLIAGTLLVFALSEKLVKEGIVNTVKNADNQLLVLAYTLGLLLFVISVYPRGEAEDLARAYNMMKQPLSESIPLAYQGLLANTFWIGSIADTGANGVQLSGILISTLLLALILYFFWNDKRVLISLIAGLLAIFAFAAFVYGGGVRQWGMLFILFLVLLQLYAHLMPTFNLFKGLFLLSIFGFQLYYCSLAVVKEIQYPFSNAENTAAFLAANVPQKVPIVAINPFENGAVAGYLGNERKVYTLPSGEPYTWFKWLAKVYLPAESELKLFAQYKGVGGIVVLTAVPLPPQRYPGATLWKHFDSYSIKNENFYVYTLAK
ncbi:MAG: hypothetical protein ACOYOA_10760 [Saprospiraceae bacterium]